MVRLNNDQELAAFIRRVAQLSGEALKDAVREVVAPLVDDRFDDEMRALRKELIDQGKKATSYQLRAMDAEEQLRALRREQDRLVAVRLAYRTALRRANRSRHRAQAEMQRMRRAEHERLWLESEAARAARGEVAHG